MIVDLRKLTEHRGRLTAEETVEWVDALGGSTSIKCQVKLGYQLSGGAYYFHGDLAGEFETSCHRCLVPTHQSVGGEFDVVVRRSGSGGREPEDNEEPNDDYITLSLNEHEVSFDQVIYESLIVNIPMQIVCRSDCKGLCPTCGVNRNDETCQCTESADPRWDALNELKKKVSE